MKLESNEEQTFRYLTLFGLNVELIRPTGMKTVKNPDALILGTIWEAKAPVSSKRNTVKNRFRKASKQAQNVIFDLRFVKEGTFVNNCDILGSNGG